MGWSPVRDVVPVGDFHATLLHLFGLEHLRLTRRYQGLDQRLTSVTGESRAIRELLA